MVYKSKPSLWRFWYKSDLILKSIPTRNSPTYFIERNAIFRERTQWLIGLAQRVCIKSITFLHLNIFCNFFLSVSDMVWNMDPDSLYNRIHSFMHAGLCTSDFFPCFTIFLFIFLFFSVCFYPSSCSKWYQYILEIKPCGKSSRLHPKFRSLCRS